MEVFELICLICHIGPGISSQEAVFKGVVTQTPELGTLRSLACAAADPKHLNSASYIILRKHVSDPAVDHI
jgi:hypothetical protein